MHKSGKNINIKFKIFYVPSAGHKPIIDQFYYNGSSKAINQLDKF